MEGPANANPPIAAAAMATVVHSYSVRICHWINVIACVVSARERRSHPARLPRAVLGEHRLSRLPGGIQALGLGPLMGGGRRARRPPVGTQLSRHLRLGLSASTASSTSGGISTRRHFRNRMLPARDELTMAHLRTELRDHLRWRSRRHAAGRQLRHAAEDVVSAPDLRVRAVHDPDRRRAVTGLHGGDAGAAGSVRRPSVGAHAAHHRHRRARALRRRPPAGDRRRGIRRPGPFDDHREGIVQWRSTR